MQRNAGNDMTQLKLLALDEEDLAILSSHLQDAVVRVGDMTYLPSQNRFVAAVNRFAWEKTSTETRDGYERRRTALRFDRVRSAKLKQINPIAADEVLSLLAISFESTDQPSGFVTLAFSGGPSIRLEVECIEAELKDLGPAWGTRWKPRHPDDQSGSVQS